MLKHRDLVGGEEVSGKEKGTWGEQIKKIN